MSKKTTLVSLILFLCCTYVVSSQKINDSNSTLAKVESQQKHMADSATPSDKPRGERSAGKHNDLHFAGTYIMADGSSVTLTSDGRITGHPAFEGFTYEVVADFSELFMDAIKFKPTSGPDQLLHYVLHDYGFELYQIVGNKQDGYSRGRRIGTFKRSGSQQTRVTPTETSAEIKTRYFDLPTEYEQTLAQALKTSDLTTLGIRSLEVMGDYLKRTVLAGHSQFGPFITSSYFWYVYNALPDFVTENERHQGYYKDQNDQSMKDRLMAYAIYRIDRNPDNIEKLFAYARPLLQQVVPPASYLEQGVSRKVNDLLGSYEMIRKIENYDQKLSHAYAVIDTMTGTFVRYEGYEEFRKFENSAYGFSVYELDQIIMQYLDPESDRFHSFPADLSFWMRRNHEGNMQVVYSILIEINQMYDEY